MTRSRLSFSTHPILEEPIINLTPLIDVVFVILIMFILIAPLLKLDRIELADGPNVIQSSGTSLQEISPITIHVHHDNTIWFNEKVTNPATLIGQLKEAKDKFPHAYPQVLHDKKAHFGTYQAVKNAAEEAGFSHIDIILKPA
jgi:biopolymer transport protein ExbD